jgi:hypothetical protein
MASGRTTTGTLDGGKAVGLAANDDAIDHIEAHALTSFYKMERL